MTAGGHDALAAGFYGLANVPAVSIVRDLGGGPTDGFDGFPGEHGAGEESQEDSLAIAGGVDGVEGYKVRIADRAFVEKEFGGAGEDASQLGSRAAWEPAERPRSSWMVREPSSSECMVARTLTGAS